MKNLAIATTLLFAAIAVHSPENLFSASIVTCASYCLWGFELWVSKKFEKEEKGELSELDKLELQHRKSELTYKIAETERQQALRNEAHVRKQKQEKLMENGIGW